MLYLLHLCWWLRFLNKFHLVLVNTSEALSTKTNHSNTERRQKPSRSIVAERVGKRDVPLVVHGNSESDGFGGRKIFVDVGVEDHFQPWIEDGGYYWLCVTGDVGSVCMWFLHYYEFAWFFVLTRICSNLIMHACSRYFFIINFFISCMNLP